MVEQKFNSGMPVIANLEDFDKNSGGWFERVIFRHRMVVVVACLLATVVLGFFATRLQVKHAYQVDTPIGEDAGEFEFEHHRVAPE